MIPSAARSYDQDPQTQPCQEGRGAYPHCQHELTKKQRNMYNIPTKAQLKKIRKEHFAGLK